MKIVKSSELELKGISWTWPGRIPSSCVCLIEGDPGTSKSTLCCTMAAHVSTGKNWPDNEPCPKGDVLLCNAEDPEEEVILPRLIAAKADLQHVSVIVPSDKADNDIFTIPDHVGNLEKAILEENVKLLVFDPLEAFLSVKVNNYSNHHIRHALRSLEQLAKKVNCSIVIVRHLNKDSGKSAIYRGGGSIGIIGAARASILVSKDPTDKSRCLMVPSKANWSAIKDGIAYRTMDESLLTLNGEVVHTSRIVWDGEVPLSANDVLQPSSDLGELTDLDECSDFLRNALKDGPRYSNEVFSEGTAQGFLKKVIYRAAKLINVLKYPEGTGKAQRWIWELEAPITSDFLQDQEPLIQSDTSQN